MGWDRVGLLCHVLISLGVEKGERGEEFILSAFTAKQWQLLRGE